MRLYWRFAASIYQFYKRNKDSMPDAMTFWATSAVISVNLWMIYEFLYLFIFPKLPFSANLVYSGLTVICLINYLVGFRNRKYQEYVIVRKFGFKVILYIVISIFLFGILAKIHHDRSIELNSQTEISNGVK